MGSSILGNPVLRREDDALVRGEGQFVANRTPLDAAHIVFVRSSMAHARLRDVDTTEATQAPGVIAVFTAADLGDRDLPPVLEVYGPHLVQPMLARDVVRFVGEPVAIVVADTVARAVDAAELVVADAEPLRAVVDLDTAALDDTLLFPAHGTNTVLSIPRRPEPLTPLEGQVVVVADIVNQRLAAAPIEGRVAAADWDGARLTFHASSQGAHTSRDALAAILGLDTDAVRVQNLDVGGGFGAKGDLHLEELLVGWVAMTLARPVQWVETRTENLQAMVQGRAQQQRVTVAGRGDGTITAYRLEVVQDAGAYPHYGAILPRFTRMMQPGPYAIDDCEFRSISLVTNTTPVGAFRGAGRPEATAALERAVDLFAAEVGLDPIEVRRRNLLTPDVFPYTNATGTIYDSGDYAAALDRVVAAADLPDLRAEQQRRRQEGDRNLLGVGVSVYVEITAPGAGSEFGSVELTPDGAVVARTGSTPFGQGHLTTWAMLVADRLGIDVDEVTVIHGDTDTVPEGGNTGGSRSVQLAGSAIADGAERLVEQARQIAADQLEAAVDDIVFDHDRAVFHVAGTPARTLTWTDLAETLDEPLRARGDVVQDDPTVPFGAHLAVVEVDADTGAVELTRLVACDDAGTIINPLLATGQIHGGLAQGVGQALYEAVHYDDDGNPLTTNFADYSIFGATELPFFERIPMETPTHLNPLGAKGIGESGTVGATPAVQNAVVDAISHLGVRHVDLPLTPERVWRAISG
ncbi:MAG: xanthine dehydrogenase family protein molybdopterin-binding subunit [Acidimicrobiia bacterium]|nr:xanthine dehydrogenase family protein molybdopterin-binding subunit [Acidimicrobiia bacterium]